MNMKETLPISQKFMLSIKEASQYFSIGVESMRRLAEDHQGEFAVMFGHRYLIIRTAFEEFVLNGMTSEELELDGYDTDLSREELLESGGDD